MIRASQIHVQRGRKQIIAGLDLELRPGEVCALVGPNGAGKSTLLRALAGELPVSSGTIHFSGKAVAKMSPAELAARRAVFAQRSGTAAGFRAIEVVGIGRGRIRNAGDAAEEAIACAALDRAGMAALAQRRMEQLSGGEQQRVHWARVLAQMWGVEQPVYLLDEPVDSLDLEHQHLLLKQARREALRGGVVFVVLHDLNLAAAYADRVVILSQGRLVADGKPEEVLTRETLRDVFHVHVEILCLPGGTARRIEVVGTVGHTDPPAAG